MTAARACKDDVAKLCADRSDESSKGAVLACLRDAKPKLNPFCKKEVFRTQQEVRSGVVAITGLLPMC